MPTRKCRIEFEGTPGLYRIVSVELDLADVQTGEKATVKSSHGVFVAIPSPRDDEFPLKKKPSGD